MIAAGYCVFIVRRSRSGKPCAQLTAATSFPRITLLTAGHSRTRAPCRESLIRGMRSETPQGPRQSHLGKELKSRAILFSLHWSQLEIFRD